MGHANHLYAIAIGSNRPHGRHGRPPGVVAAAIQLHEIPSRTELVGMALIVAALVANALPARSEPALAATIPIEGP